jgi:hypothetical protein
VDRRGNVYVTGALLLPRRVDIATIKYSPEGALLWAARYHGSGERFHYPRAMAVDRQGNVYVTGVSYRTLLAKSGNYATIKYSSEGEELWARLYDGPGRGYDSPAALALDKQGNVYVTGVSRGAGTRDDYATIKYSSNGRLLWVRRYDGPGSNADYARAMAIDDQGNIYVTGMSFKRYTRNGCDYATIKYSPDGETLWVRRFNGVGNYYDCANAITVDRWGNFYVTGISWGGWFPPSNAIYDYATIKYNPDGEEIWVLYYNGIENLEDSATAIAVDKLGNVYVTGYITTDSNPPHYTCTDYCTIKYRQHGRISNYPN